MYPIARLAQPPKLVPPPRAGAYEGRNVLDFYSDSGAADLFRQHIAAMLTRVNTFTGVPYREDPTIMAWNVLNEPRCPGCDAAGQVG